MNLANAKRTLILALAAVFMMALMPATALASRPYFKAFGSDVFTGGWFWNGNTCLDAAYQDDGYTNGAAYPPSNLYGGIQTYARTNASGENAYGGSSSRFAAFALGLIDGPTVTSGGFYSSGATYPTTKQKLSFANDDSTGAPWGGLFQGDTRQSHCIPDYFGTKQNSPGPLPAGELEGWGTGQYRGGAPGTVTTLVPLGDNQRIENGRKVTIFIDGDAYIGGDIEYRNNYKEDSVPKLAVIVKGNLYIDPAVTRLDGVYIAQPRDNNVAAVSADQGVIWTCHPNNNLPVPDDYPNSQCNNPKPLVVNGSLIAKQVNLLRIRGDLDRLPPERAGAEDRECAKAVASKRFTDNGIGSVERECANIAEVINFMPEMVIGGPFFNPPVNRTLKVQSLISLPPVF